MSAAVRAGYKLTEVGIIPGDWEVKQITEVCDFIVPGRNKPKFSIDTIPWITTPDLEDGGEVFESRLGLFVSRAEANSVGSRVVPAGSIVMSCVGELGITAYASCDIVINQQLHAFIPSKLINGHFLLHAIKTRKNYLEGIATKTALPYLNKDNCNSIRLPFPELEEQRAIATALSDVDALLAKLDALIAKKRDLKIAAMQQLLTGQTRLPGFQTNAGYKKTEAGVIPEDWDIRFLGDICQKITTGKLDANAMVLDGDYPFFTCAKEHYWIDNYAFNIEALLVSGNGANVGYIHHYIGKFNAYQRTYVLTGFTQKINFIKLFMERNLQNRLRTEVNSGNTPYIVMDTLSKMNIALPSNIDEQTAIATVLSDMDTELTALEARREKTRAVKQGMMQELLTGRIRLVNGG